VEKITPPAQFWEKSMAYSLDEFCGDCHDILIRGSDDAGREQIRANLEKLLANADFVSETFQDDMPASKRALYHDEDTDVFVYAHVQEEGKRGNPHSHGASWAIYGNAVGITNMTMWHRTNAETDDHAELEITEEYAITPGVARAYGPNLIHSTQHPGKAWVIRVTGTDLDDLPRYRFDASKDKILETA
jgi:hypothetical protein